MDIQQLHQILLEYNTDVSPSYMYIHPNSWVDLLKALTPITDLSELLGLEIITTIGCPRDEIWLTSTRLDSGNVSLI